MCPWISQGLKGRGGVCCLWNVLSTIPAYKANYWSQIPKIPLPSEILELYFARRSWISELWLSGLTIKSLRSHQREVTPLWTKIRTPRGPISFHCWEGEVKSHTASSGVRDKDEDDAFIICGCKMSHSNIQWLQTTAILYDFMVGEVRLPEAALLGSSSPRSLMGWDFRHLKVWVGWRFQRQRAHSLVSRLVLNIGETLVPVHMSLYTQLLSVFPVPQSA